MRIVHVTDTYLPTVGGVELHVRDLVARLRQAGHDTRVLTRQPAGRLVDPEYVLRVGGRAGAWLEDFRPDVVHTHISFSPFALAATRWAAGRGLPTVATVHSMSTGLGPLSRTIGGLSGVSQWPVSWTAVSEAAAVPLRRMLGVPVAVLPNGVDLDEWQPPVDAPIGPPRVVAVMRLTRVKRTLPLARILHRVARHVDVNATVVGDGPQRDVLQRYLRHHGLDHVRLTGVVGRDTVRRELADASVFIAPAHRESFGIAALEARAMGLPVVASSRSGVGTFVSHGLDGLLGDNDEQLSDHLVRLLTDHELRTTMASHSRGVPPGCSWADVELATAEAYARAAHLAAGSSDRLMVVAS